MDKITQLKQIIKDAGVKLAKYNLVQGTWGNISMRIDKDKMLVTPSGMDYNRMTLDDIVIVDINTLEYDSPVKPTSEKKIHAAIYRDRPEINAIIHSHPYVCSVVASARVEMPVMSEKMQKLVGGSARIAGYGLPGTKTLMKNTVAGMANRNACFMANHGIVACGTTMEEAFETCQVMEESSRQFIDQKAGGNDKIKGIFMAKHAKK